VSINRKKLLERAETALRESKHIDFKSEFDLSSSAAWCELIKDMVAFANSGGGIIIFGVENDGTNSSYDSSPLLAYDTADVSNKIAKYTGFQLADLEVVEIKRKSKSRVAFLTPSTDIPIVFTKPGTYDVGGGKQKTAFGQGTIYFRHGSKSEPGNLDDLVNWRDREIARMRSTWMRGIRKVVQAGSGDTISVVGTSKNSCFSRPVRI
jgi:predicted HTH transcriptional regulator